VRLLGVWEASLVVVSFLSHLSDIDSPHLI
jgi:hypothetical protein